MPVIETVQGVLVKALDEIVAEAGKQIGKKIISLIGKKLTGQTEDLDLEPYWRQTYKKCSMIDTLINRDAPVGLIEKYVPIDFIQDNKEYKHDEIFPIIEKKQEDLYFGDWRFWKKCLYEVSVVEMFFRDRRTSRNK